MLEIEAYPVDDAEDQWNAWNQRCLVSHYHHFVPARNDTVAFSQLEKPISELRIALVTSGGVYHKDSKPFDMQSTAGDDSLRWIPADVLVSDLRFEHDHYDHHDAEEDPNCMFPIERLRELSDEGIIGSIAASHLGFMGWIPNPDHFIRHTLPEVIARFQEDHVDAAVFSPG